MGETDIIENLIRRSGRIEPPRRCLAVDWDGVHLHLVEAAAKGGKARPLRWRSVPLPEQARHPNPPPETLGRILREAVREAGFKPAPLLMAAPRSRALVRSLDLPPAESQDVLAGMVYNQAAKELTFPIEEAAVDFCLHRWSGEPPESAPSKEGGPETKETGAARLSVLTAVIRKEELARYEAIARAAGLKLAGLTLGSLAAVRCAARCVPPGVDCFVLATLSARQAFIEVGYKGQLLFSRVAPLPQASGAELTGHGETGSPAAEAGPFTEALLTELFRNLQDYEGLPDRPPIQRFLVAGGTGLETKLAEAIEKRFGVLAEPLDPAAALNLSRRETDAPPPSAAALGMAMAERQSALFWIDFLHPKRPPKPRDTRRIKALVALAALSFLFMGMVSTRTYLILRHSKAQAQAREQLKLASQNLPLYRRARLQLAAIRNWETAKRPWLDHLALLSSTLPPAPELFVMNLATSPGKLTLTVKARSAQTLDKTQQALRKQGYQVRPAAITPSRDRRGYRFQANLELIVPPTMKIDVAKLPPPPARPPEAAGQAPPPSVASKPEGSAEKRTPEARPPSGGLSRPKGPPSGNIPTVSARRPQKEERRFPEGRPGTRTKRPERPPAQRPDRPQAQRPDRRPQAQRPERPQAERRRPERPQAGRSPKRKLSPEELKRLWEKRLQLLRGKSNRFRIPFNGRFRKPKPKGER